MKCERCGEVNPAEIHTCSPQEPVAWFCELPDNKISIKIVGKPTEGNWKPLYTAPPHFIDPAKVARLMDEAFERGKKEIDMEQVKDIAQKLADCALLNSAPPQREWQGLTDEEVEGYWDWEDFQCGAGRSTILEMVRDIEAKLKEKNT